MRRSRGGPGPLAALGTVAGAALVGLAVGLTILVGWPAGASATETPPGDTGTTPGAAPVRGAPAPDFVLAGVDGVETRLSDHLGEVVLINFWATWCGACQAEMPLLDDRYTRLRDSGLVILAVNNGEDKDDVASWAAEQGLSFPVLLDPGAEVQRLYRVLGYPTSVIVGRSGVILDIHLGVLTDSRLDRYLREAGLEP